MQAREIAPQFLARLQTYIKTDLQPKLDELDALNEFLRSVWG